MRQAMTRYDRKRRAQGWWQAVVTLAVRAPLGPNVALPGAVQGEYNWPWARCGAETARQPQKEADLSTIQPHPHFMHGALGRVLRQTRHLATQVISGVADVHIRRRVEARPRSGSSQLWTTRSDVVAALQCADAMIIVTFRYIADHKTFWAKRAFVPIHRAHHG